MTPMINVFRVRIGDYEAISADCHNIHQPPYHHIDIVKWDKTIVDGKIRDYCYTIGIITDCSDEDADLRSVGLRLWACDLEIIKKLHELASDFLICSWRDQHP